MIDRDVSPLLIWGIYLFGIAFMLTAAIDLFTTVWPLRPTEMTWRYGFLGLAAGYLQTPALGLLMVALGAIWQRNARLLRAVGVTCLVLAVVYVLIMGIFALDVIQIRQIRAPEAQAGVLFGGLFQLIKYLVAMCVFVLVGQGCLNTAKRSAASWAK